MDFHSFYSFAKFKKKKKGELLFTIGLLLSKSNGFNMSPQPAAYSHCGISPAGGGGSGPRELMLDTAELGKKQSNSLPRRVEKRGLRATLATTSLYLKGEKNGM